MSNEFEVCVNENSCDRRVHKRNYFTLNDSDIQTLWDYVSEFVESHMLKQKGVNIPGLGTFSFNQVKLDVGQNKYVLLQRPLFLLSEKICQTHNLRQSKMPVTGSIPIVGLNYSSLMLKSSYTRDQVEICVRELITATNSSIANQSSTELVFTRIGRLQIRNQTVKFKFYKSFISILDSSGKVMSSMQNRPGTADSVMSERPPTRSFSNIIPLPKIPSSTECQKLPTINELELFEFKNSDFENQNILNLGEDVYNNAADTDCYDGQGYPEHVQPKIDPFLIHETEKQNEIAEAVNINVRPACSVDSHPMYDETINHDEVKELSQGNVFISENNKSFDPTDVDCEGSCITLPTPKPPSKTLLHSETKRAVSVCSNNRPLTSASSTCGHPGPNGYDLCYVCYQREKRNVPVSFAEQLKEREQEEERVLQAFQNMKDTEHLMKEQEKLLAKKHDSQKISAFNAGVADTIRSQQKTKDPNMYRSYLFEHRPLTPPKIIKQTMLSSELGKQVERKITTKKKNDEEEAFMERLEQMQLAEDLVKQRDQYIKGKEKSKEQYRKALDSQVLAKPLPIPKYQPDSEESFFGKNDVTQEKLVEKKMKAQEVLKNQMECAEQKKRDMLIKKMQEQNHEEKVLDKVKHDLIEDRARRYHRALQNRLKLEGEWEKAKGEKKERELVERLKISMPDCILMHEQCDKYTRCSQCKRKLQNTGQSNVWKETYFVPGTRYIY